MTNISRVKFKSYEALNINHLCRACSFCVSIIFQIFLGKPIYIDGFTSKYLPILSQNVVYPQVNVYITMDNHHFLQVNPLFPWPFSIAFCMFTRGQISTSSAAIPINFWTCQADASSSNTWQRQLGHCGVNLPFF